MRGLGKGMKGSAGGGVRRGFHDPLLLHRVAECVADASHRKRPLDPDELADGLRRTHREYQRKQRGPFLRGVAQAIQIVLERTGHVESRGEQQLPRAGEGGSEGQNGSEEGGGSGSRVKEEGAVGEEESEEEGSSEGEKRREGAGEEQYEDAREEQGGGEEGESQEQGLAGEAQAGHPEAGLPRPGAPSAESASLTTCGSSRYTSSVSMATAKGTLPGSANQVDQERQKTGAGELQEGEGALHGARSSKGPAEKCLAGIGPASQQPLQAKAKAEAAGEPPGHPPSKAGSSKNKRQAGAAHPAPDPQSKRRRQAPQTGPGPSAPAPPGSTFQCAPRRVPLSSLGGIEGVLGAVRELVLQPLAHPQLYAWLGVQPPRGVLLHGPPGCGKTMLAHAIAHEAQVPFFKISAPEIVSGMSGESEAKIRDLFREAEAAAPSVVFIDEIDAITPKRETAQREMERRIVAQLLTCIDDLGHTAGESEDSQGEPVVLSREGAPVGKQSVYRHVVVLGATNRPDALDPALRRAGRFDREIAVGIPDEAARARILEVLARGLRLQGGFDFRRIARRTAGFVGADLAAVAKEAAALAVKRILSGGPGCTPAPGHTTAPEHTPAPGPTTVLGGTTALGHTTALGDTAEYPMDGPGQAGEGVQASREVGVGGPGAGASEVDLGVEPGALVGQGEGEGVVKRAGGWSLGDLQALSIRMEDFEGAVGLVQPSAKREGFSTIPGVTWADVGALGGVKEELRLSISRPIHFPEEFQALGLSRATGVLLYGPPGCGKTLVAQAIANDAGANFISIKGPELLNKFVGESERGVRQLFARARSSSPCILFFDEMDAMAPRRGADSNGAAERVVNQLLTEMDGLEGRGSVFLVAATNRPDMLDPALLRPGRLDRLLYVPLPDTPGRVSILRTLLRKMPCVGPGVEAGEIGGDPRCARFSGADLAALVREACVAALRERLGTAAGDDDSTPAVDASPGGHAPPAGDATPEGDAPPAGDAKPAGDAPPAGDAKPAGDATPEGGATVEVAGEGLAASGGLGEAGKRGLEHTPALGAGVVSRGQDGVPTGNCGPVEGRPEGGSAAGGPVICVERRHFDAALQRIRPSVSPQDLLHYERVRDEIHGARGHLSAL